MWNKIQTALTEVEMAKAEQGVKNYGNESP
jgi:hypothetical protein